MIDLNLFKDFLSGDGASEEYMRNALHVGENPETGHLYSLLDDQESSVENSFLNDEDDDEDDEDDDEDEDDNDDGSSSFFESVLDELVGKAEHIERASAVNRAGTISFGKKKICATRHGCTGATNCDYSLGAPIGR